MSHVRQSDRAFGQMFAMVFFIIGGLVWFFADNPRIWPFAVSVAFLLVALSVPWLLLPLNRLWGVLARALGTLSNYLLLGLFFGIVVIPTGLVMRLVGKDPMSRAIDKDAESYFSGIERHAGPETFRDMF